MSDKDILHLSMEEEEPATPREAWSAPLHCPKSQRGLKIEEKEAGGGKESNEDVEAVDQIDEAILHLGLHHHLQLPMVPTVQQAAKDQLVECYSYTFLLFVQVRVHIYKNNLKIMALKSRVVIDHC